MQNASFWCSETKNGRKTRGRNRDQGVGGWARVGEGGGAGNTRKKNMLKNKKIARL